AEILTFETPEQWRSWLAEHHTQTEGMWLRMFKKSSGRPSLTYAQALDEALCYGWIDGQPQKDSEESWLQRFTPRRPRSPWSLKNTKNFERLRDQDRMQT